MAANQPAPPSEITLLLRAWGEGDHGALDRLTPLVYEQLRRQASRHMRHERPGHQLQTTALVHEAFLRLDKANGLNWQDRGHFFAVAARVMRRILVDAARAAAADKRGGGFVHVSHEAAFDFDALPAPGTERPAELCALDDALSELAIMDPRRAQVVELRFFGGLGVEETAESLGVSPQTVMRDWRLARAWLMHALAGNDGTKYR
ncbi:MAG: sigma-70 family RNA polymerase sigma factor [Vicinamibacteraceae bacterium]